MPVHDFNADIKIPQDKQDLPLGAPEIPAVRQLGHAQGGSIDPLGPSYGTVPATLEEFLQPGFRSLDEAMKNYFSGIRVPTKDSYRMMRVKIAGGDKSLLLWADDIKEGRARLPLAAISRDSHEFNPLKFSPAYHPMSVRYVSSRGDRVLKVFRPVPYLVQYSMTIWAEHKRDAEYILYQILTRYNPVAEFRMYDGKLVGNVLMTPGNFQDASDKEAGYDQKANVRYEFQTTAEAWLPLPEKLVPTVLGRVGVIKEKLSGIIYETFGIK